MGQRPKPLTSATCAIYRWVATASVVRSKSLNLSVLCDFGFEGHRLHAPGHLPSFASGRSGCLHWPHRRNVAIVCGGGSRQTDARGTKRVDGRAEEFRRSIAVVESLAMGSWGGHA